MRSPRRSAWITGLSVTLLWTTAAHAEVVITCDGVTDVTAAVQAAADANPGGVTIRFMRGPQGQNACPVDHVTFSTHVDLICEGAPGQLWGTPDGAIYVQGVHFRSPYNGPVITYNNGDPGSRWSLVQGCSVLGGRVPAAIPADPVSQAQAAAAGAYFDAHPPRFQNVTTGEVAGISAAGTPGWTAISGYWYNAHTGEVAGLSAYGSPGWTLATRAQYVIATLGLSAGTATVTGNQIGLLVNNVGLTVRDAKFGGLDYGIVMYSSTASEYTNIATSFNRATGVYLYDYGGGFANYNQFRNLSSTWNEGHGLFIHGGRGTLCDACNIENNAGYGVLIDNFNPIPGDEMRFRSLWLECNRPHQGGIWQRYPGNNSLDIVHNTCD